MRVMIISDGTGETATLVTRAALAQFEDTPFQFTRFKNVRSQAQIDAIFESSINHYQLIVYTVVSEPLRQYLQDKCTEIDMQSVDLIGPLLTKVEKAIHKSSKAEPGIFHAINAKYFDRIEAMEFAVRADDGKNSKLYQRADIILVGISRTSKTPLSIYLSHHGYKVANLPIVLNVPLTEEVEQVEQTKFIGLTINPDALLEIRKQRLKNLGSTKTGEYANMEYILEEIDYANKIFSKHKRWPVFNVTGKALEEIASEIVKLVEERRVQN